MTSVAYAALWIVIFAVPWERLVILPGLSIVTRVTGAIALGLTLLAIVVSGRIRRWPVFHTAAFLFVIWTRFAVWMLRMPTIPTKYFTRPAAPRGAPDDIWVRSAAASAGRLSDYHLRLIVSV
jgi:hypothetical protein